MADPQKLPETLPHIISNFRRLGSSALTEEEVTRAKNQLKASLLIQMDNYSNICEDIGRQMLTYGRHLPLPEIISKIDQITKEDIILTAQMIFNGKDHAMAAVGPIGSLPSYEDIRNYDMK